MVRLVFVLLFCLIAYSVRADSLLASTHYTESGGGAALVSDHLRLDIFYPAFFGSPDPSNPPSDLFRQFAIHASDVGTIYTLDQTNGGPNFEAFVAFLTNGINDPLTVLAGPGDFGGGGTVPGYENTILTGLPFGSNGFDLHGFNISHITLEFTELTIVSPGSDPNHNGQWTDYTCMADVRIYGEPVPEPSTEVMCVTGMILLCAASSRRPNDISSRRKA
jgi:hypothetical protein